MPAAVKNADGSVVLQGLFGPVTLSASDVSAIQNAKPAITPLTVVTRSGRSYGQSGTPRYGIAMDSTGKWHFLDKNWRPIANTSWKARNLSAAKFTFHSA